MFGIFTRKNKTFWEVMDLLNWAYEGDDEKVIRPVIDYLSKQSDSYIFDFHEKMAELLYAIDGKPWAESYKENAEFFSDDGFLYSRCVAIINGEEYYNEIKNGSIKLNGDLEFESILYVPISAWAKKHKNSGENYPYVTNTNYESGSNADMWM